MCGIAGIYYFDGHPVAESLLNRMAEVLSHRGPDSRGKWLSRSSSLGFSHSRLAIVDHSFSANQPMHYAKGRYTIVYNGEIYNFKELKAVLIGKGYAFETLSDTEVIPALYDCYGEDFIAMLDGMFAFALWDEQEKTLLCARDRFGEKPFYFYCDEKKFLFASEMKGLKAYGLDLNMSKSMLFTYLLHNTTYNSSDRGQTFYEKIRSLEPAHVLVIKNNKIATYKKYWTLNAAIDHSITLTQAESRFKELMYDSVSKRIQTDVKYGSSLSGGLDSSTLVSIIEKINPGTQQNTFSAFFPGFAKDEQHYVNCFLEQQPTIKSDTTYPDAKNLVASIDKMLYHQEFPIEGPSVYAQYEIMRLAKSKQTKVVIDGQGADETMGGYNIFYRYYFQQKLSGQQWRQFLSEKKAFQKEYGELISFDAKFYLEVLSETLTSHIKKKKSRYSFNYQMLRKILNKELVQSYELQNFSLPYAYGKDMNEVMKAYTFGAEFENMLRFSDRNSMSQSIEVRMPFLSHELVNFLFTLPVEYRINKQWTKYLLRTSFSDLLPPEIAWRKEKVAFETPNEEWMKTAIVKKDIIDTIAKVATTDLFSSDAHDTIAKNYDQLTPDFLWRIWVIAKFIYLNKYGLES